MKKQKKQMPILTFLKDKWKDNKIDLKVDDWNKILKLDL